MAIDYILVHANGMDDVIMDWNVIICEETNAPCCYWKIMTILRLGKVVRQGCSNRGWNEIGLIMRVCNSGVSSVCSRLMISGLCLLTPCLLMPCPAVLSLRPQWWVPPWSRQPPRRPACQPPAASITWPARWLSSRRVEHRGPQTEPLGLRGRRERVRESAFITARIHLIHKQRM